MVQCAKRKEFTFLRGYYETTSKLPDKQRLALYDAIVKYSFELTMPDNTSDAAVEALFVLLKSALGTGFKEPETGVKCGKIKEGLNRIPSQTKIDDVKQQKFDEFWKVYPRKVGKLAAKKAWGRIKPAPGLYDKILLAVEQQKKNLQWQRDNGQYIPHPSTWLNQGRWDDEPLKVGNAGPANFTQREYSDDFFDRFISNNFGES